MSQEQQRRREGQKRYLQRSPGGLTQRPEKDAGDWQPKETSWSDNLSNGWREIPKSDESFFYGSGSWIDQRDARARASATEFNLYVDSTGSAKDAAIPGQTRSAVSKGPTLYGWDARWMPGTLSFMLSFPSQRLTSIRTTRYDVPRRFCAWG